MYYLKKHYNESRELCNENNEDLFKNVFALF